MTAAHPIRGRDWTEESGPPTSLEKMGNSNHMGFWRSPARETPSYFPWPKPALSYVLNSDSFSSCRTEFACHLLGKYCLRVYRALTCMLCFLALLVLWDEQSGCYVSKRKWSAGTGMFKSHRVMAEKARAPAPSSILHKTIVRVFCRGQILIKDE